MMSDIVAAYRGARARARRTATVRLRRQERQAWAAVLRQLDESRLASLAAVRDELQARGEKLPPIPHRIGDCGHVATFCATSSGRVRRGSLGPLVPAGPLNAMSEE
jgi:hypothetical protein